MSRALYQLRFPPTGPRRRFARARGFSLVEAMVSAGIIGVMLVASINLLGGASRTRTVDNHRRTALFLAQQLMSEIQQQDYKDSDLLALVFGPELGENTRADYDDVDDYNNYRESPPAERSGVLIPGFNGWERKVKVDWVTSASLQQDNLLDTGLKRIEVIVTDPRGGETSVFALRSAHVEALQPPPGANTLVWTGIELDVGGDVPHRSITGINLVARPTVK